MKRTFLLISTFLILTNISCQTEQDLSNIKGIEIYLFQSECRNENSYNEYKTESEQRAFSEKYKSSEKIPKDKCGFYIDLDNCITESEPFLGNKDIESFDWTNSKIILTESGIEKLNKQEIPLQGLAFVLTLNGKNIYAGWFWNILSSFGCDRVWASQNPTENELNLAFGLGGFKCGEDPRTDENLIWNAINN